MCNEFARWMTPDQLRAGWGAADAKLLFPEAVSNMPALDSIRITDSSVILRAAAGQEGAAEVVTRRWSWPARAASRSIISVRTDASSRTSRPAAAV